MVGEAGSRPRRLRRTALLAALALCGCATEEPVDPLPSWNDGASKRAIVSFVEAVTREGSAEFVPVAERIAVFDNDGTLWSEQPIYFQLQFALDRVKAMAPEHPEWNGKPPFQAVLDGDTTALVASGKEGLFGLLLATHTGMTADEFQETAHEWLASARHPRFDRRYDELIYQPMLELLAYLRDNDFQTWIVSGGGIEFVRAFCLARYGIPPEQVVGSSVRARFELRDGTPVLVKLAEVNFIDDGPGKPVGIHQHVGRRPIAAFGNSDGDLEMLQWTAAGEGKRLAVLVHHTDAEREWAYDRESHIGRLGRALDEAASHDWTVVDMRQDWKVIYPFQAE